MSKKRVRTCVVFNCSNRSDQGRFVGDLCAPCHAFVTRGEGQYSQIYRNACRLVVREMGQALVDGLVGFICKNKIVGPTISDDELRNWSIQLRS